MLIYNIFFRVNINFLIYSSYHLSGVHLKSTLTSNRILNLYLMSLRTAIDSIKGSVVIGNNVWIGDNVIILSGVTVGDGSISAASVVTKDVAPYYIAVGNPPKLSRKNSDEKSNNSKRYDSGLA